MASEPLNQNLTSADYTAARSEVINAINQMFAEFQLVYNNQYHKAFPTTDKLEYAKRLWFSHLKDYSAEQVLTATQQAIKSSEFLPTVRGILKYIDSQLSEHGLPEPRQAYIEACRAPNPKAQYQWSHAAVYHAGQQSDWFFLASNVEQVAYPVFEKNYKKLCDRVIKGEQLSLPDYEALPEQGQGEMSREERMAALAKLRKDTGL